MKNVSKGETSRVNEMVEVASEEWPPYSPHLAQPPETRVAAALGRKVNVTLSCESCVAI